MNISQMIEWLKTFDPETEIEIIESEVIDVETTEVNEFPFTEPDIQSQFYDYTNLEDDRGEFGHTYSGKKILVLGIRSKD